jgi:Vault protein inter-alpha-trypsin domain/von Willebrand factor type A domain
MAYYSYNRPFCGCFYIVPTRGYPTKKFLPQVDLSSHTTILSSTSRTTLTQTFINPSKSEKLEEVKYVFPLYDGVSVVEFKCTIAGRVIVGVVKEKQEARKNYKEAVDRGETAGLLEQFPDAADSFTTRIGNVPAGEKVVVEITYLGELKHDAETDGVRFTIPTVIAPRYGQITEDSGGLSESSSDAANKEGIRILVDVAVEDGVTIRGVQSPSHPVAMIMGRTSYMPEDAFDNQHASVTLTLEKTELDKDFIIVVTAKGHDTPRALLETHPILPNHRALMATLVPKFNLPSIHPEIVFVADRSGSMDGKIPILVSALKIFLKSLPIGVKFNICSFGSENKFLWPKSKAYDESSLAAALKAVESFRADFGGTEMLAPVEATVKNRFKDLPLEVIVVTDGEIWNQNELFNYINESTTKSVRFFSLGIGHGASSSLVEGIARAGDGFSQFVGENEKMDKRVVRMLKGALSPHIKDYTMEVKYEKADEEYEVVELVTESSNLVDATLERVESKNKDKPISLFDTSAEVDDTIMQDAGKFDHLPDVKIPKLLQAPHKIPALFPFNRTSVYLLMSPESCQHTPKSVVIRATSEYGPLKLEIPVQDIGRGETVHQLAAKKAVHELENGRGWLTEAKTNDGKLLKSEHEGRWDEIVEREAVRLGIQFQVGGKWCSFVALEKNIQEQENHEKLLYEMVDRNPILAGKDFQSARRRHPAQATSSQPPFAYINSHPTQSAVHSGLFGDASRPSGFGSSSPFTQSAHSSTTKPFDWSSDNSFSGAAFGFGTKNYIAPPSGGMGGFGSMMSTTSNVGQSPLGSSFSGGLFGSSDSAQAPKMAGLLSPSCGIFDSRPLSVPAANGTAFGQATDSPPFSPTTTTNTFGSVHRGEPLQLPTDADGEADAHVSPVAGSSFNACASSMFSCAAPGFNGLVSNALPSSGFGFLAAATESADTSSSSLFSQVPNTHTSNTSPADNPTPSSDHPPIYSSGLAGGGNLYAQSQPTMSAMIGNDPGRIDFAIQKGRAAAANPFSSMKKMAKSLSLSGGGGASRQSAPATRESYGASPSIDMCSRQSAPMAMMAPIPRGGLDSLKKAVRGPLRARKASGGLTAPKGVSMRFSAQEPKEEDDYDDSVGDARYVSTEKRDKKSAKEANTDEERMHELISLQNFDGSWKLTTKLLAVLKVQDAKAKGTLPGLDDAVLATLLAVAFLEGMMGEEEGLWEMVVEKAKNWLEEKIGEKDSVEGLAKAKKDVFGVAV